MKASKLMHAMSYIDDDLIAAAEEHQPRAKKKPVFYPRYMAAVAAACIVLVLAVGIFKPYTGTAASTTSASMLPSPGDPGGGRAFFCLGGDFYFYFGESVGTLPAGFSLVGEVDTEGEAADFSGNIEGNIYMSESDRTVAYIKVRGEEKYIRMELKK